MTRPVKIRGKNAEICVECGMLYKDKKMAQKCEAWCKKNRVCSVKIIKHAIKLGKIK